VILRCTRKLLAILGPTRVADPAPDDEDWYANLLWFDRRKCLLLTHAATLFSIFEADVTAADLRATRHLLTHLIERELAREGLPSTMFADLLREEVVIAKTADRSVLGCMNDMAFMCEHAITGCRGLRHTDLAELNQALRRNINSTRGYQPPIELAATRLDARGE
jgi:hypothetical protein